MDHVVLSWKEHDFRNTQDGLASQVRVFVRCGRCEKVRERTFNYTPRLVDTGFRHECPDCRLQGVVRHPRYDT